MDETILTFNVTNLVTVTLMAVVGFFLLGLASQAIRRARQGG